MSNLYVVPSDRRNRTHPEPVEVHSPYTSPIEPSDEVDLRELGRKLWRRKSVIAGTVLTLVTFSLIVLWQLPPSWRAEAQVLIDSRKAKVARVEEVLSGITLDNETVRSEMLVLRSRDLARKAIARLGLERHPDFDFERRTKGIALLSPRSYLPEEWATALLGPSGPVDEADVATSRETWLVDEFLRRLVVTPEPRSRVIAISFEASDARTAAAGANAVAELYLRAQSEDKFEATARANEWLTEQLGTLKEQLLASERAVEDYRQQGGFVRGKDTVVAAQEVSEVSTQLVEARGLRVAAEARLRQAEALQGPPGAGSINTVSEVLQSQLIQRLREQETEMERRLAQLTNEYGENHPRIGNARAEIRDLRARIDMEIRKIIQALRNEASVARAREASLVGALTERKDEVVRLNQSEVQLRALEREAEANRGLYASFLTRFKETSHSDELQQPDARIISRADVPRQAAFPRKDILVPVAIAVSLVLGLLIAFAIERLDDGFRSMDEVEHLMGMVPLGLVPTAKRLRRRAKGVGASFIARPNSIFAEAIRGLQTKLVLAKPEAAPRTVLIASSLPREGKTTVAIALAASVAAAGRRVLLIDADLRKRSLQKEFNFGDCPAGLVDYLSEEVPLAAALQREERLSIDILPAGRTAENPPELLASERMKELLAQLAVTYDLVVVDSAPVLAVSDTLALCRMLEQTVFVTRWADTRRAVAMRALRSLFEAGAQVAGVLLSQVDVKKHASYGYADSGFYYGRVREYYSDRTGAGQRLGAR